jgi:outer membrane protein OmpA-like peptidoglycan-associated protein
VQSRPRLKIGLRCGDPLGGDKLGRRHIGWVRWLRGLALLIAIQSSTAFAQDPSHTFHLRTSAAGALMLSKDQRGWLRYDQPGLLADVQLAYAVKPWLDVQVGATGGVFMSREPGGLAAPMFGVLARLPMRAATPYALLDLGVGFTGAILRPFARSAVGLEFALTRNFRAGPNLGLGMVTQWNNPGYSTDAVFAWFGLSCSYWPTALPAPLRDPLTVMREPPPEAAAPKAAAAVPPDEPEHPPSPPSPQLVDLLDRALPMQRSELLAPVLFAFDSSALEPGGIAMLHEVARVLCSERADIELLEIVAYADARGSDEYNRELARRRAQRVLDWLAEHGVARERLQISAEGAVDFVESGNADADHQQNRRVVFRMLRTRQR